MADSTTELEAQASEAQTGEELEGPDYTDTQKISKRIDKALEVDKYERYLFESDWFRNINFIAGNHYIIKDKQQWRQRNLPTWYPRAQSNKFAEKFNDIVSAIIQAGRVPIRYTPATDDPGDSATAEVGERIRDVMYAEARVDEDNIDLDLSSWLVATGNAFLIPYYDYDEKYGTQFVQSMRCTVCGEISTPSDIDDQGGFCPYCAQQGQQNGSFEEAEDPNGAKIGSEYPIGSLCVDVCGPFEIRADHRIKNWKDQRRFVRLRRYDVSFARDKWPKYKQYISEDSNQDGQGNYSYLDSLARVTSSGSSSFTGAGATEAATKVPKCTVFELFELPSEDYPQGLRAVRVGSNDQAVVEAGPLNTEFGAGVKRGQKFLGAVHFVFDKLPGRLWGKTRLDDLVPLQVFRNTVEANLRLSVQRMGNGAWLVPKGSNPGSLTGEPGLVIDYNPLVLGGTTAVKPERMPAELNHIQALVMLINKIDDTMERVAGTFFLQGGETPPGVTAASALAYLGERSQKAMSPLLRSWAKGWKTFEEYALEIIRQHWDDKRIRVVAGRNRKWETQQFDSADLIGAVNMHIDYEGLFPKSQATERATIGQLIQLGAINPQDPEQQWTILKKFGETDIKGSVDVDTRKAIKEQEEFLTNGVPPKIKPGIQNSQIHLAFHKEFANTDEYEELPPEQQSIWDAHIQAHIADIQASMQSFGPGGTMQPKELDAGGQGAAQQNGGVPNGAQGPDQRLGPNGEPQQTPDIAAGAQPTMPPGIHAPREAVPPDVHHG